jgi:hypothetical protein
MWAINDDVLRALAQSDSWKDSGLNGSYGFTPQLIYGPKGKLPQYWGRTWDTAGRMYNDLCFNMGGGVPIAVIQELVNRSESQCPALAAEAERFN